MLFKICCTEIKKDVFSFEEAIIYGWSFCMRLYSILILICRYLGNLYKNISIHANLWVTMKYLLQIYFTLFLCHESSLMVCLPPGCNSVVPGADGMRNGSRASRFLTPLQTLSQRNQVRIFMDSSNILSTLTVRADKQLHMICFIWKSA